MIFLLNLSFCSLAIRFAAYIAAAAIRKLGVLSARRFAAEKLV